MKCRILSFILNKNYQHVSDTVLKLNQNFLCLPSVNSLNKSCDHPKAVTNSLCCAFAYKLSLDGSALLCKSSLILPVCCVGASCLKRRINEHLNNFPASAAVCAPSSSSSSSSSSPLRLSWESETDDARLQLHTAAPVIHHSSSGLRSSAFSC